MYCKKCGSEIDNDSLFCSKCGQKINSENNSINSNNDFFVRGGVLEKYLGNDIDVIIPDDVFEISNEAFKECRQLTSIKLSSNVEVAHIIDCDKLNKIEVNAGIKKLFVHNCPMISDIELPFGIEEFGFARSGIRSITIPASVKNIKARAFEECKSLQTVVLPDSVEAIEWRAFYRCAELKSINLSDNIHTLGKEAFRQCEKLENIHISSKISVLPAGVFQECHSLTEVVIPFGVTRLEGADGDSGWYSSTGAFMECKNLKKVALPDSITFMHGHSFMGCKSLNELVMSNTLYDRYAHRLTTLGDKHNSYITGFKNTPISWKFAECCQYCGNKFEGIFNKKCSRCGKPKDY